MTSTGSGSGSWFRSERPATPPPIRFPPRSAQPLLDYFQHGRRQTNEPPCSSASWRRLAPLTAARSQVVPRYYLHQAGIQASRAPARTPWRHTCVQRLVDADFPFKVIGDYVGHRAPESTEIYTKVAVEALREVALGDGEEIL